MGDWTIRDLGKALVRLWKRLRGKDAVAEAVPVEEPALSNIPAPPSEEAPPPPDRPSEKPEFAAETGRPGGGADGDIPSPAEPTPPAARPARARQRQRPRPAPVIPPSPATPPSVTRSPIIPSPRTASFLDGEFDGGYRSLSYKLYTPGGMGEEPRPLLVMLHGCTQSPDDFAAGTRMNALAEEHGCCVAYPAQTAEANAHKCWNWFSPDHQAADRGEPALIAALTRRLIAEHSIDPRRVYAAGLSAGGAEAAVLGAVHGDLFAAIGVHSGLAFGAARNVPGALAAMRWGHAGASLRRPRPVPTIVFQGDQDKTVHPRNADHVVDQVVAGLRGKATSVEEDRHDGGRDVRRSVIRDDEGRVLCERWLVAGLGHAWSGGSADGSYADPEGPDASRRILDFLLAHRLVAETVEP